MAARRLSAICYAAQDSGAEAGSLPSVAILGIGLMGNKMARRLQEQGFKTAAWNRDGSKSAPLAHVRVSCRIVSTPAQQSVPCVGHLDWCHCRAVPLVRHGHQVTAFTLQIGCKVATSAEEAVSCSDVVVLVLSDAEAIRSALLDDTTSAAALKGKCVLQMGTIGPEESSSIAADAQAAGAQYIEAPVLGSQPEASRGTLLVMVGCDEAPESTPAWPVIQAFGQDPLHIGKVQSAPLAGCMCICWASRLCFLLPATLELELPGADTVLVRSGWDSCSCKIGAESADCEPDCRILHIPGIATGESCCFATVRRHESGGRLHVCGVVRHSAACAARVWCR
jgi:3-hydroxyisobutyrate dehydrogenase-like beta-hydroxyacid dehydrogenase